jgi:chitinase
MAPQHAPGSRRTRAAIAVSAAAALAVGGAIFAAQAEAASTNLLTNPSFSTGTLSGWSCDAGTASVVTSPVYTGDTYALAGAANNSDDAQCTQTVSVQPNTSYTLSGEFEGNYVYLGIVGGADIWTPSASSWTQLSTTFTTGASQTSVTVYTHGWYAQGTYYADNLALTGPAGSGSSPSASPSTASASPSPSASPSHSASASPSPSASASASASPTASSTGTSGTGSSGLPKHVLAGYWQDFTNGAKALTLAQVPQGYNLVDVAFATADSANDGGVTFSIDSGLSTALGGYTAAQFTSDVATLHARGQKVVLSVGGQNGTISIGSSTAATNFANSVYALMKQYGFDGVDIDLENGVNATYTAQALQDLHNLAGSSLIITLAPQTIDVYTTGGDYFQLALDIKSILTISYTQYYNSGSMNGCDGNVYSESTENFMTALACTELENGFNPSQVGLGLPASTSAAGSGYVAPSVVDNALDCLASGTNCGSFVPPSTWPGIGGAMTWSINWDASNGYAFLNTVGAHLAAMP